MGRLPVKVCFYYSWRRGSIFFSEYCHVCDDGRHYCSLLITMRQDNVRMKETDASLKITLNPWIFKPQNFSPLLLSEETNSIHLDEPFVLCFSKPLGWHMGSLWFLWHLQVVQLFLCALVRHFRVMKDRDWKLTFVRSPLQAHRLLFPTQYL